MQHVFQSGKGKRELAGLLCVMISLLLWSKGAGFADTPGTADRYGLRYDSGVLFHSQLANMEKNDARPDEPIPSWCAWTQRENQSVVWTGQDRSVNAAVIVVFGHGALALPQARYLRGRAPIQGNQECALSSSFAESMFNSDDVLDKICTIDGQDYVVCGVYDAPAGTVMVQHTHDESGLSYVGLEISNAAGAQTSTLAADADEQAEVFLSRFGLPAADILFDYSERAEMMRQLVLLPGWVLLASWAVFVFRRMSQKRAGIKLGLGAFDAAVLLLGIWLLRPSGELYIEKMPTRWSDFEYWSSLWQGFSENLSKRQELPGYLSDLMRETSEVKAIACIAASLICGLPALSKFRPTGGETAILTLFIWCWVFFLSILQGRAFPMALWLIWPVYWISCWLTDSGLSTVEKKREMERADVLS